MTLGTDGKYTYCGDHFGVCANVESLCCTPETNIMLQVNYSSFKERKENCSISHPVFTKSLSVFSDHVDLIHAFDIQWHDIYVLDTIFWVCGGEVPNGESIISAHKELSLERIGWYPFPRATLTKHHKLGGLKQQKFILLQSGGDTSRIKPSAGIVPVWGSEGEPVLLVSGGCPQSLAFLACGSKTPVSVCCHMVVSHCVSVFKSPFY